MSNNHPNIADRFPREARLLRLILITNALFLSIGLIAPVITLKKFVLVENTFSVLSGLFQLLREGQYFLFIIIFSFSVCLPVLKIMVLYILLSREKILQASLDRYLKWMHLYGKWSMLDVFVVAVMVVAVKLGAVASAEMRYGLYAFAVAVLLTMLVTARVVRLNDLSKTDPV